MKTENIPTNYRRNMKRMMMKVFRDTSAFPCNEFDFERCVSCHQVQHHLDELLGIADSNEAQFYKHHGNQPIIFPTMNLQDGHGIWNGLLHYTSDDIYATRAFIKQLAGEMDVVIAYEDPYTNLYHFIIDTHEQDLSDENFRRVRKLHNWKLHDKVCNLRPHHYNFYVRALPLDHYEILDRNALFGDPEPILSADHTSDNGNIYQHVHHRQEPTSVGSIIKSAFGRLFAKKPLNL